MGCDAADTPPSLDARPPAVSSLALTPAEVLADTLGLRGDSLSLPLAFSVRVQPGDAPLARVAYSVRWQFACTEGQLEASGQMEEVGEGVYAAFPVLQLPRGRRGGFRVTAYAVGADGRPSNEAVGTLTLRGANAGPPVIAQVEAPAEVRVPASGTTTVRFRVTVTDPDGVDDIARAEVQTPAAGTFPLAQTDDQANRTPCDGVFSTAFSVPAGTPEGTLPLVFQAYDRQGAVSEPVTFTVTLVP